MLEKRIITGLMPVILGEILLKVILYLLFRHMRTAVHRHLFPEKAFLELQVKRYRLMALHRMTTIMLRSIIGILAMALYLMRRKSSIHIIQKVTTMLALRFMIAQETLIQLK